MSGADQTPSAADVIRRHTPFSDEHAVVRCGCTYGPDRVDLPDMSWPQWNAHVAEQVESLIAAREQAAWERLCDWLDDHVDSDVRGSVKTAARMTNPYRIEGGKP